MGGLPLLDRVTLGDHVCWAVDDDAVRMEAIAGFVRAGLRARQKVLYCGDDPDGVVAGLHRHGVGARAALASGQLGAHPTETTYLSGGRFDPVALLDAWRGVAAAARAEGYPGVRVLGDMTWASRPGAAGAARLPWYEAQVNEIVLEGYVAGVCAYDRRRFDPLDLRRVTLAHLGAAATGTPFDPEAALRVVRTRRPYGVRLEGEADLSNRDALGAVAAHLFDGDPPVVTVDVTGLRFADTAATRLLLRAAASAVGRLRLVGCSPALLRLLDFHGARDMPTVTVEPVCPLPAAGW